MQGSSTGGKDRPLNSLWEKAINGAQKLFGSEKSEAASLDDKSENEERSESSQARSTSGDASVGVVSGFTGRRFGSFGGAAFGGNTFGTVATSRAAPETSFDNFEKAPSSFDSPKEKSKVAFTAKEQPVEKAKTPAHEPALKEKVVAEDGSEEEASKKAKPVDAVAAKAASKGASTQPLVMPAPAVAPMATAAIASTAPQSEVKAPAVTTPVPVVPQQTAQAANAQAQGPALPAQQATVQAPSAQTPQVSQGASNATGPQTSPLQVAADSKPTNASTAVPATKAEAKTDAPAQAGKMVQAPVVESDKPLTPTDGLPKKVDTPVAQTTSETTSKPGLETAQAKEAGVAKENAGTKEGLGFDVAKAKEAVSEALGKASSGKTAPQAAQSTPVANQQTATAQTVAQTDATPKAPAGETLSTRLGENGSAEAKDTVVTDSGKRDVAAAQQRNAATRVSNEAAGQARSGSQEGAAVDPKAASAATSSKASASQFARESAVAAASRVQAPVSQGKGTATSTTTPNATGLNGISGGQSMASGATTQGVQQGSSQNSGGDTSAKQDLGAAMKQASTSAKGGEKSPDGAQSFEAKVEAAANRRSEAAGKASQTSYVSKTAAEVKEVVATLTKSIDRLISDKSGAMNLKINFQGGGSLSMKISMEGGQVATSMQTDVVGLEGAIKANWGELANDWNQKGVKLVTPQFQNSESGGKDSSFENLNEFASKQDRQSDGRTGDGRARGAGQSSSTRGFSDEGEGVESDAQSTANDDEVVSDSELKTYA